MISFEGNLSDDNERIALVQWMNEHLPSDIVESVTSGGYTPIGPSTAGITITLKTDAVISATNKKQIMANAASAFSSGGCTYYLFGQASANGTTAGPISMLISDTLNCRIMSNGTFILSFKVDDTFTAQSRYRGFYFFAVGLGKLSDDSWGIFAMNATLTPFDVGRTKSANRGIYTSGNYTLDTVLGTGGNVNVLNGHVGRIATLKLEISDNFHFSASAPGGNVRYGPPPSETTDKTIIHNLCVPQGDNLYYPDIYVAHKCETEDTKLVMLNGVEYFCWYGIMFFKT